MLAFQLIGLAFVVLFISPMVSLKQRFARR
jgi:hypothetical protein